MFWSKGVNAYHASLHHFGGLGGICAEEGEECLYRRGFMVMAGCVGSGLCGVI